MSDVFNITALSTNDAYLHGRSDVLAADRHHIMEIADAIHNWTAAQADHADVRGVRAMRAYWLGVARTKREGMPSIKKFRR